MKLENNHFVKKNALTSYEIQKFVNLSRGQGFSVFNTKHNLIIHDMKAPKFHSQEISSDFKEWLYDNKRCVYGVVARSEESFWDYCKVNSTENVSLRWVDPNKVDVIRGQRLDGVVVLDGMTPSVASVVFPAVVNSKHVKETRIRREINELKSKINELEKKL